MRRAGLPILLFACGGTPSALAQCEYQWSEVGGGVSAGVSLPNGAGDVRALLSTSAPPFSEPSLIVGGNFTLAGGLPAPRIARWNGAGWSTLGGGIGATAHSLAMFDDGSGSKLYVGGEFTQVSGQPINYIARWDGVAWSSVGLGTNDHVRAMVVHDDGQGDGPSLFAGGLFPHAGPGISVSRIAKWNGNNWSALGSGMNGFVLALTVFDDGLGAGPLLIAGGQFTTAGGQPANYIARWNGANWAPLGSGLNNAVFALAVYADAARGGPSELYAGGFFTSAGGVSASRVARWNGVSWSPVGLGVSSDVNALAVFSDILPGQPPALYVGGLFSAAGAAAAPRIARWDGAAWTSVGSGLGPPFVFALAAFDVDGESQLHAGGRFAETTTGQPARALAHAAISGALGDANGDYLVDFDDITTTLAHWNAQYPAVGAGKPGIGDANRDGIVNMGDLSTILLRWGRDCRGDMPPER